ncbi:alcohol dehydrogenase catalytic domain-containing protein [Microbacterium sp. HD4P20]|uniref:alcohol dehydrogenase catalytic domain-containing protein n=1 Tax=Microbacterium sp. HD4P20 TaxID=2864874 RepID=UPI001C643BBB|nr:alcohol dehydrogenase catalytic domain-containing protein [Microbacterium sp. HD4P20]MCP2636059.1 alcohol dehydrogenase catalytic domain-containing protein [Microbacterium sp. HD4P20]
MAKLTTATAVTCLQRRRYVDGHEDDRKGAALMSMLTQDSRHTRTPMMRAARLHEVGQPMVIEEIERPRAAGTDVIVEVKACGMVPNLANVLANWETWYPHEPLPPRPAIFGLDPVGVIAEVGEQVVALAPGDRVYVNPTRSCGACHACASGVPQSCDHWTFAGYFGFNRNSLAIYEKYPQGGFCEFMKAPQNAIVPLPDNLDFRQATRLGYLGTAYAGLKKLGPMTGKTLIIDGATGTLGVGVTLLALATGVSRIFAVARGAELLARVKALAPDRIDTFSNLSGSTAEWVRDQTGGRGADAMIDTLGAVASLDSFKDAMHGVGRGGRIVNIGGTAGELGFDVKWGMDNSIGLSGSAWFTTAEGMELVDMIRCGVIDMSVLQPKAWAFEDINAAINGVTSGDGGFTSYLVEM